MSVPDQLTAQQAKEAGIAGRLKVMLNGVEVHGVNAFCMSKGWVDLCPKDGNGRYIADGDQFKIYRRYGIVEVTLDESD